MGHLYRVSWLINTLQAQNRPELEIDVYCHDTLEAREYWALQEIPAAFFSTSQFSPQNLGQADVFVVDWLDSNPSLIAELAKGNSRVVLLDDYGPAQQHADLVVNSLLVDPLMKSDQMINQARVIRSIEWIQLPPEVTKLRGVAQASTKALETELAAPIHQATSVQGVVVSFGGLPIRSLVVKALKALSLVGFEGRTIVMPAPSAEVPTYGLDVEFLPPSSRFHSYLAAADLAICAAGLTLYEAAFLGVPTVCLAVLSTSGQHRSHQLDETGPRMQEAGACRFVGLGDSLSPQQLARHIGELLHSAELRGRMSANGMRLLDGKGLIRTADAILSLLPRSPH